MKNVFEKFSAFTIETHQISQILGGGPAFTHSATCTLEDGSSVTAYGTSANDLFDRVDLYNMHNDNDIVGCDTPASILAEY